MHCRFNVATASAMTKRSNTGSHTPGHVQFDRVQDLFLKLNPGPEPPQLIAIPGPDGQSIMVPSPQYARWSTAMEFRMHALAADLGIGPDVSGEVLCWDWYRVALQLAIRLVPYFGGRPGRAKIQGTQARSSAQDELLDKVNALKARAMELTRDRLSDVVAIRRLMSTGHLPAHYTESPRQLSIHTLRGQLSLARKRRREQDRALKVAQLKP